MGNCLATLCGSTSVSQTEMPLLMGLAGVSSCVDLPITPLHIEKSCTAAQKRFAIAMPLAVAFGLLCVFLASSSSPGIWGTALMWTILTDRILIGMVVGLA